MTAAAKLDPRSKLVIVLCLSTLGVFIQDIYILAGVLAASILLSVCFGSRLFSVVMKMKRILWLFVAIAVIQSVFSPAGKVLLSIGSIDLLTSGGLTKGVVTVLRMTIILVSATIMTTSNSREIIQGFVQWKVPYEIAFMVSVAVRFMPLLAEEIKNVIVAMQLKGIELDKIPVKERIKIYSYLIMPVVSGVMIKSRDLSTAMETRAFRAFPRRTSYMVLRMNCGDYLVIISSIVLTSTVMAVYYL